MFSTLPSLYYLMKLEMLIAHVLQLVFFSGHTIVTVVVIWHLDVILVLEQRGLHDVSKEEVFGLDVEGVSSDAGNAIPVSPLHRFVGHHLQQRTTLAEVVDLLLQVYIRLPVLQALRQLLTPASPSTDLTDF